MMQRLHSLRVLLVGVGGVGSWCAEALVREGVGHLTIVDADDVAVSNINRQMPATTLTVGRPKVDVLAERLLSINPKLDLNAEKAFYDASTATHWDLDSYDYVIDAIDSLSAKAQLILNASASKATLLSSMGAARKLDPAKIAVAEFWKVQGCPLARALRQHFKRNAVFPRRKFRCVYSPERLPHLCDPVEPGTNGTFAHATAIFGLTLAAEVMKAEYGKNK